MIEVVFTQLLLVFEFESILLNSSNICSYIVKLQLPNCHRGTELVAQSGATLLKRQLLYIRERMLHPAESLQLSLVRIVDKEGFNQAFLWLTTHSTSTRCRGVIWTGVWLLQWLMLASSWTTQCFISMYQFSGGLEGFVELGEPGIRRKPAPPPSTMRFLSA